MSNAGKVVTVALLAALAWAVAPLGQIHLRGYQLCVKHAYGLCERCGASSDFDIGN